MQGNTHALVAGSSRRTFGKRALGSLIAVPLVWSAFASPARAGAPTICHSSQPHGVMLVTPDCEDPDYNRRTFIIDKVGEVSAPTPHTRVQAHFQAAAGKPIFRVTIDLAPVGQWQGRFFQHAYPLEQPENAEDLAFALHNGGYLVNVKGVPCGCGGYRPDAAAAKLARQYARDFYKTTRPIFGYLWGGSGGGLLTIGAAENTQGVWQGIAPYVMPNAGSLLNINAAGALASLALHDKLATISEAVSPGSRHDPMTDLSPDQRAVFTEVLALGIPEKTFEGAAGDPSSGGALLMFLSGGVKAEDPGYVDDFWSKPGYEGVNPPAYLSAAKRDETIAISGVKRDPAGAVSAIILDHAPNLGPLGPLGPIAFEYWLYSPDGKSKLGEIAGTIAGNTIQVERKHEMASPGRLGSSLQGKSEPADGDSLARVTPGYKVRVNNLFNLALHYYHRHALPLERDMYAYDFLRNLDGTPLYPQRAYLASTAQAVSTAGGAPQTGKILNKVIINQSMLDGGAAPWMADWYAKRVRAALGPKRYADNFRLYYNDNAVHLDIPPPGALGARVINYVPALYQSILDLVAWAEHGVSPLPSSTYTVSNGQVHLAPSAELRRGLQPVVQLEVAGSDRIEIPVNQPVTFKGRITVPPGAGHVTSVAWWFGDSPFNLKPEPKTEAKSSMSVQRTHTFSKPGTFFVTLWATSQRDGNQAESSTMIQNLARVRVIVR